MNRRCLMLILPMLLLAGYLALRYTRPTRVTEAGGRVIRYGMTHKEVLAVMCVPPRDYRSANGDWPDSRKTFRASLNMQMASSGVYLTPPGGEHVWLDDDGDLAVYLDKNGLVVGTITNKVHQRTWLERFQRWLGL